MRVRQREYTKPQDDPEVLHIPKDIEKDITERGFHLYKWINPEEVKLSIERDFLKTIKYIGLPLGIIAILGGLLTAGIGFVVVLFIGIFFMFLYLFILSIRRSLMLSKSAFVVLTDSSISLGGKVQKLSEISKLQPEIHKVSKTFEEDLFGESNLAKSKKNLTKSIMDQLFGGYRAIFSFGGNRFGRSRDSEQGMLVIIALYTIYIVIMGIVYFVGVLGLLVFGKLITWINTKYLERKGEKVIKINSLFQNLDNDSEAIKSEGVALKMLLTDAKDNNWKDGLLLKIEDGIEKINRQANSAIENVLTLKETIKESDYKDMFSYPVYNAWIKKQIQKPLEKILELLMANKKILETTKSEIEIQIENTHKIDLKAPLELTLGRVEMQLKDVEKFIPVLEASVAKLSN